ncbi:MAG: type II toxin-antitoxin system VapC family toxin [Chloroflexota bacterium]|nr:type II toxin-antitoxin system VapC family toxin [Chloroflexota bacterium]MDE2970396.1 type II toxin-antitoxin system VapC family toxin [Chloroflexota bacterium]
MFLLDTNVLSALRRPDRNPGPAAWLQAQRDSDIFLSVVTIAEVERGIALQRPSNPDFARDLALWAERILSWFADRVLPVDAATARRWGNLSASLGNQGLDLLIAATALERGLTVVTRNVRHFEPTGVSILDPYVSPGEAPSSP